MPKLPKKKTCSFKTRLAVTEVKQVDMMVMKNSYSPGKGVIWVAIAGEKFDDMTWKLGGLLTKTIGGYPKLIVRIE